MKRKVKWQKHQSLDLSGMQANNNGADQAVLMRRLVFAPAVHMQIELRFSRDKTHMMKRKAHINLQLSCQLHA